MKTVNGMNVGDTFGMLTLVSTEGACRKNGYKCVFECLCGKSKQIQAQNVKQGLTKSCGCTRYEIKKIHGEFNRKAFWAWNTFGGKKRLPFQEFLSIFNGIEDPANSMTEIGVMPKKIAVGLYRHGCAQYPAISFCVFISGRDGASEASRKTGFDSSYVRRQSKKHPEVYAAGLQARAEREAASKPAPPSLPVNTSVDF